MNVDILKALKNNEKIQVLMEIDKREARAAPLIPIFGIKIIFNEIFVQMAKKLMTKRYICMFSFIIQMLLTIAWATKIAPQKLKIKT